MSKYDPLWRRVSEETSHSFVMTFDQIHEVLGFGIDHSFLTFKKELPAYGYTVGKISLKQRTVVFDRVDSTQAR
jgi:hypothetical protein